MTGQKRKCRLIVGSHHYHIDKAKLPEHYPTHHIQAEFWEILGRTVGTFGYLEEVLSQAIYSLKGTHPRDESEMMAAYEEFSKSTLQALTGALGSLVKDYEKALREHPEVKLEDADQLIQRLKDITTFRNIVCHAWWRPVDNEGKSQPTFADRKFGQLVSRYDAADLDKLQRIVADLAVDVHDSVAFLGEPSPGNGVGAPAWTPSMGKRH